MFLRELEVTFVAGMSLETFSVLSITADDQ